MITNYPMHFEGTNFHNIDAEHVRVVDALVGAGQSVRYDHNLKIAVFRSNNLEDLLQVEKNGGWSNTTNALDVQLGYTIYVIPNMNLRKEFPTLGGVRYTLTLMPYKEEDTDKKWASELI